MNEKKMGLSGSALKLIAMVTMLIDHIGATLVWRMVLEQVAVQGIGSIEELYTFPIYHLYELLRGIGRIAFPIYCFLLIEGFEKTRSRTKYALRLGVFALISEIPFDLAFNNTIFEFTYQNVFFTLLIGVVTMIAARKLEIFLQKRNVAQYSFLAGIAVTVIGAAVAEGLKTDYGAIGIFCIMVLYIFRKNKLAQTLAGCVAFLWETTAPLAFIPIWFYNGRRGQQLKYVFYVFYPLHLLVLYFVCVKMGWVY